MIRNHTIFTLYCAILLTLLPLGCGENINEPADCGDPLTLTNIPATPLLGGYPTLTNQNAVTLFGTKSRNTNVVINVNNAEPLGVEVAPSDCLTTWVAEVNLTAEGENNLDVFSLNGIGGGGPSAQISIARDTGAPTAPTIDQCPSFPCNLSTSTSPLTLSGSKEVSESVFINTRLVVGPGGKNWSYDVTLGANPNTFLVQLQDAAGNRSDPTTVTVTFSGNALSPPKLISPLGNIGVVDPTPLFKWQSLGVNYRFQFSDSIDFSNPVEEVDTPSPQLSLAQKATTKGYHYWRVGVVDGTSVFYGPTRRLTIGRSTCNFNGDTDPSTGNSLDDLIIGSYENDAAGNNAGRAFVYFGNLNTGPGTAAKAVLTGETAGDHFGISVACAGDLNSDGFGDIIVGAFLNDAGGEDAGRAYIFFGGASMDGIADLVLTGQAAGDQFGLSVSTAGDINTDGFDDVIVGAYQNDGGGTNVGRAYIYFGGTNMDNLPDVVLTGQAAGDQFGIRVAWAGDVNGDTYDDVIVGADRADVGNLFDAGKAYIFFGGPNMAGQNADQADVILEGATDDEAFASVAWAGDLNNDGFSDVVVGASAYKTPGGTEICTNFIDDNSNSLIDRRDPDCYLGRAYVFLGGPTLPQRISVNNANFILERPSGADGFGFSVASGGDVNGDGFSDLLVGAFLSDKTVGGVTDAGRAYLYLGRSPMKTTPDISIEGDASPGVPPNFIPLSGQFGFSLAGAGDVNGDGISDIIIGAYLFDTGILFTQSDVGRVYLFYGRTASAWPSVIDLKATSASQTITGSESDPVTGRARDPLGPDSGFGVSVQ